MPEENLPDSVKKFYAKQKAIKIVVDTTDDHHRTAYSEAVAKHLKDDRGQVDYSKLDDESFHDEFVDTLTDSYLTRITKDLNISIPDFDDKHEEEVYKSRLLNMAAGVTKAHLKGRIQQYKSKYTQGQHAESSKEHIQDLAKQLAPTAADHLVEADIDDVIKYTGIESIVDKTRMKAQHLGMLLSASNKRKNTIDYEDLKDVEFSVKPADYDTRTSAE